MTLKKYYSVNWPGAIMMTGRLQERNRGGLSNIHS